MRSVLRIHNTYLLTKDSSRVPHVPARDDTSTPPAITLNAKALETNTNSFRLQGTVSDETHVEDVYIFVGNQSAKIDNRTVFYRSNRSGKDKKLLDFTADLPLWPGSNIVTIVARENAEVRSVKTLYLYRDPPRTAQSTP